MARESRRGVLPYLKQQRKLNFLVGKNIQLWLARLQTRCKHAVCWVWPARAVLVLTVSIKLETLMEQNCLDCLRWDITRLIYLNVNQLIQQSHSRIQQLLLVVIFRLRDINSLKNTDWLIILAEHETPHHHTSTSVDCKKCHQTCWCLLPSLAEPSLCLPQYRWYFSMNFGICWYLHFENYQLLLKIIPWQGGENVLILSVDMMVVVLLDYYYFHTLWPGSATGTGTAY